MKSMFQLALVASTAWLTVGQLSLAEDTSKKESSKPEATKADASQKDTSKKEASTADAPKKSREKSREKVHEKLHHKHPSLGVFVSPAHPALAQNLGDLLSPEQGLIVEEMLPHSPAAKAGLKIHDILTTYDDQKLFSADQLAKLVQADKPGREVAIGYLRDGNLQATKVTLGESKSTHARSWMHSPEAFPHRRFGHRPILELLFPRQTPGSEWDNFDSLSLKKLGDNKYRAEVQHLDLEGKMQKHVFEGTREDIRKAIEADDDLKPIERDHLLRSLNLPGLTEDMLSIPDWFDDLPGETTK